MITATELHSKLAEVLQPNQMSHWYSDLYVKVTPASDAIIAQYEFKNQVHIFRDAIAGEPWFDIPFCYDPTVKGLKP